MPHKPKINVLELETVAHLTSKPEAFKHPLKKLQPSRLSNSWEGIGISITYDDEEYIDAWRTIAELGRYSAVSLSRIDGKRGRFAIHKPALETTALRWATDNDWTVPRPAWKYSWWDDEEQDWRYSVFPTREEAVGEIESMGLGPEDEGKEFKIEQVTAYYPTKKLEKRWFNHFPKAISIDPIGVAIEATNLYVASAFPELDGVWWDEKLDPASLSAPRGVILPHAIDRWAIA